MGLGKLAGRAVKWIRIGIGWFKRNEDSLEAILKNNKRWRRVLEKTEWIERKFGETTNFFGKMRTAWDAAKNTSDDTLHNVQMTTAELRYWDKMDRKVWQPLWRPFKNQAEDPAELDPVDVDLAEPPDVGDE